MKLVAYVEAISSSMSVTGMHCVTLKEEEIFEVVDGIVEVQLGQP